VSKLDNLHFGPEVGVKNPKVDVPVVSNWLLEIEKIAKDFASSCRKIVSRCKSSFWGMRAVLT